jgi:hypothetical protein
MPAHTVPVPVVVSVPVECVFWKESDGWHGVYADLSISIRERSFVEAKKEMELTLRAIIESALIEHRLAA